ncbi:MAG: hypothetical protein ACR2MO_09705 [Acidimicrobiales bacterium]
MTEPHPYDESLSAALDGEDAAAGAHVAGCAACLARSDALRATGRAVAAGAPGGLPPGLADRAVAAAVAAFAAERTGDTPGATAGADNVVPLRPAAAGLPDSFASHRSSGARRERRVPGWLMGVAAALLAVMVAVPVLNRGGGERLDSAASPTAGTVKSAETAGAPLIEGGDLGDQADQLALGNLISGALTADAAAPALAADRSTSAASSPAASSAAGSEVTDPSRAASPDVVAASPAPGQVPFTIQAPAGPGASTTTVDPAAVAACEGAVAKEYAEGLRLGPLVYRATLRWQGTPAVLLAYRLADTSANGPDHQAFVMALDGCRLLVVQGF